MDTLHRLLPEVVRFSYDRSVQAAGIVHFGIGAFHRAHQAGYTDLAMAGGDRDWAITGVSLRSADVAGQMNPQDGLFTLAERSAAGMALRVVGSVREVLVASQNGVRLAARLAAPATQIVSLTITEKGYCRAADGSLDAGLAGGASIYRHLANAFRARRDAGIAGLTLLSCDNLSGNGAQLQRLMAEYLNTHEPDLVGWFEAECACPSTMVDRIVPATTPEDRDCLESLLGLRDEAAVITEPFSQWVIEDRFAGSRPRWEMAGAQFVADVGAYETAKLRMLNGAHSALAYLGLEREHDFVHEAIADPALRPIIERLMREEAATSFAPAQGQDLQAYADGLIGRFANPALQHRLIQIAMDGSQKLPQRWIETLAAHKLRGQRCPAILTALGAWLRHVRGDGQPVSDPLAADLAALWQGVDHAGAAQGAFAADGPMRGGWSPDAEELAVMTAA